MTAGNSNTTKGAKSLGAVQNLDYQNPQDPTSTLNGAINSDPNQITQILAATSNTPVNPDSGPDPLVGIKTCKPQEMQTCDTAPAGKTAYRMFMVSDPYYR